MNESALFLGYDPGGRGRHGVAAIKVDRAGIIIGDPILCILDDAAAVLRWISTHDGAAYLGIDTLLAWSLSGRRACDDWLRSKYRGRGGGSVIPQNSLYSSMTINGMMVAEKADLPLCESHPKLLRKAGLLPDHFEPWFGSSTRPHLRRPRRSLVRKPLALSRVDA